MNLLQRTLATLSATGTAALMTLPVLAQSAPMNNGMNNGTTSNSSTAVNCAYITGGVGGPVDTQASGNQTAPSSYDTASSGIQGNTSVPLGNQNTSGAVTSGNQTTGSQISGNQTSGNQTSEGTSGSQISGNQASGNQTAPSSYDTASSGVQGNTSVPLGNQNTSGAVTSGNQTTGSQISGNQTSGNQTSEGTSGSQISGNQTSGNQTAPSSYDTASSGVQGNTSVPLGNQNTSGSNVNQSNTNQRMSADKMSATTYHAMMQVTGSPDHRQFDANNYNAAVAFRRNGVAATSGHEAKLNLNAYQQGRNALAANNLSTSAVLPVACAPR